MFLDLSITLAKDQLWSYGTLKNHEMEFIYFIYYLLFLRLEEDLIVYAKHHKDYKVYKKKTTTQNSIRKCKGNREPKKHYTMFKFEIHNLNAGEKQGQFEADPADA